MILALYVVAYTLLTIANIGSWVMFTWFTLPMLFIIQHLLLTGLVIFPILRVVATDHEDLQGVKRLIIGFINSNKNNQ